MVLTSKYTIRSIVCEASCHPVTQSLDHSVIQSPGQWSLSHLITWSLSCLVTWSLGHLVTWSLGHLITFGHSVIWSLGPLVPWSLGHSVSQSLGHSVTIFNITTYERTTSGSLGLLRRQISMQKWYIFFFLMPQEICERRPEKTASPV